jgi:hypothetical protein
MRDTSRAALKNNKLGLKHGYAQTGMKHPLYTIWSAMKDRCHNPNNKQYADYGGRGITVCDRWRNSFPNFLEDMGERPEGLTLERSDNDGNYEPSNCVWETRKKQAENRRNTRSTCTVPRCDRPHRSKGLCVGHLGPTPEAW